MLSLAPVYTQRVEMPRMKLKVQVYDNQVVFVTSRSKLHRHLVTCDNLTTSSSP
jgi:hypothetical protein